MQPYDNFDLLIDRGKKGRYRAKVIKAPIGGGGNEFRLESSTAEWSLPLPGYERRDLSTNRDSQKRISPREFGGKLFRAVFSGEVIACWDRSLARAESQGRGLHLRLLLKDVPELSRLPWELLYDERRDRYLALFADTPVIRYLDVAEAIRPLQVELPLRILVVIASPSGYRRLNVDKEWEQIEEALELLAGSVILRRLEAATLPALRARLKEEPFHVLHFIGHGGFLRSHRDGVLLFEKNRGAPCPVTGQRLGVLLSEHPNVRLVVLNTCEGALSSESDAFSGVAQRLVQHRLPAVVAMQLQVRDGAAISFSRHFYGSVAEGRPLELAVTEARRSLYFEEEQRAEWAVPVVYLRCDGQIFELVKSPADLPLSEPSPVPPPLPPWKRFVDWLAALPRFRLAASAAFLAMLVVSQENSPSQASVECPSPPGLDLKFTLIHPGTFTMGYRNSGEATVHRVEITRPFCLSIHELTQAQWRRIMGSNPSRFRGDRRPVERVSWFDAQSFLGKLRALDAHGGFRLPTEAQWEYAARAGTDTRFSFGEKMEDLPRFGNCRYGTSADRNETRPVGRYAPNAWDLYDMYGNVSEWVADWYDPEGYGAWPQRDPTGSATGKQRVRRGGGWSIRASNCNSFERFYGRPLRRDDYVGFRVVRDPLSLQAGKTSLGSSSFALR